LKLPENRKSICVRELSASSAGETLIEAVNVALIPKNSFITPQDKWSSTYRIIPSWHAFACL
jgi:hypothetical protein